MVDEDYDFIFKVLLLGNSDVGKSSLLIRYVDQTWTEAFVPTIGVDFKVKTLEIENKKSENADMGYCRAGAIQKCNIIIFSGIPWIISYI